jgi:hypothetical protein
MHEFCMHHMHQPSSHPYGKKRPCCITLRAESQQVANLKSTIVAISVSPKICYPRYDEFSCVDGAYLPIHRSC